METLRTELNSNEKLALAITGMEGTGQHLIVNGEAADKTLLREKQERFSMTPMMAQAEKLVYYEQCSFRILRQIII